MKNPNLLRLKNSLALGLALLTFALAVIVPVSRFSTRVEDWVNNDDANWYLPAMGILSLVTCILTLRQSRSAKFVPLILILGYMMMYTFAIGTW